MVNYDKIFENLNSPEGQEVIKKWSEDYKKQLMPKEKIIYLKV